MKNKVIIGAIAGLLAVVFLLVPGLIGGQAETQTRAYFDSVYGVASVQKPEVIFDKGWFSSTVTVEWQIPPELAFLYKDGFLVEGQDLPPYTTVLDVSHGPVVFVDGLPAIALAALESNGSFFGENTDGLRETLKEIPPYYMAVTLGFGGTADLFLEHPPFTIAIDKESDEDAEESDNPSSFESKGFVLETRTTFHEDSFSLISEPISFQFIFRGDENDYAEISLEGLKLDAVYSLNEAYPLNYMAGQTIIDRFALIFEGKETAGEMTSFEFVLEDIGNIDSLAPSGEADLLDYKAETKTGRISIKTEEWEGNQITSIDSRMHILNIHKGAAVELFEASQKDPNMLEPETSEIVTESTKLLFSSGLEYNIPLLLAKTRWGDIHYSHTMKFPTTVEFAAFEAEDFVADVNYVGSFQADAAFVNAIIKLTLEQQLGDAAADLDEATYQALQQNMLQQLILAGYLVEEEDGYSMNLALQEGMFTINGQSLDLLGMIQGQS